MDIEYEDAFSPNVLKIVMFGLLIIYFTLRKLFGDPRMIIPEDWKDYPVVFLSISVVLASTFFITFLNLVELTFFYPETIDPILNGIIILLNFGIILLYFGLHALYTYSKYTTNNDLKYSVKTTGSLILITYPLMIRIFREDEFLGVLMIAWPFMVSLYAFPVLLIGGKILGTFSRKH